MPWPLRWTALAVMLGFWAAIGLWAFERGKSLAGVPTEQVSTEEMGRLQQELARTQAERDRIQSILNTSDSLITAERATLSRLTSQLRQLEAENRALRDDLGFFEKLMPAGGEAVAIRGLQAEMLPGSQLKWQVLVIQPVRNAVEFRGRLQLSMEGTLDGRPWAVELPSNGWQDLRFRQYRRLEGMVDLPPQAVVKNVSAKVVEGTATRAVQSIKLGA